MSSFYEDLALYVFAHDTLVRPVRTKMKQHIRREIDPGGRLAEQNDFLDELLALKRTPDAVAVISPQKAFAFGLREQPTVLYIECEHSSPLTKNAIYEYTDLWINADDMGSYIQVAVVVVERYGRWQMLDLSALAFARHVQNGLDFDFAMDRRRQEIAKKAHGGRVRLHRLGNEA